MSLIVKIMSSQDLPDHDPTKEFKLVSAPSGSSINFMRNPDDEAIVVVATPAARNTEYRVDIHPQPGNAYVLNEQGKTIAIRNNKSEIVPIPKNEKEALKLGRGGKRPHPHAPKNLADLQNQAAGAAENYIKSNLVEIALRRIEEYPESSKVYSEAIPKNMVEAFNLGMRGLFANITTPEMLAFGQNWQAVEFHLGPIGNTTPVPNGSVYQDNKNPNVPYPTASLAVGPRGKDSPNFDKGNKHG